MKLNLTSVLVDDQARALDFYTGILGFKKNLDIAMGEYRWLTVVSPEDPGGTELLLEPTSFAPARTYQRALFESGIPLTSFGVDDCLAEHERLRNLGVVFRDQPVEAETAITVILEDTCGNLIQLTQTTA
jgi:catechol 2,3-dioxygenase-like lactoylglutathione lyase family enzyme